MQKLAERGLRLLERLAERIEAEDAPPAPVQTGGLWMAVGFAVGLALGALVLALVR